MVVVPGKTFPSQGKHPLSPTQISLPNIKAMPIYCFKVTEINSNWEGTQIRSYFLWDKVCVSYLSRLK